MQREAEREAERLAARRSEAGPTRTAGRICTLAATPSSLLFTQMRFPNTLNPNGVADHIITRLFRKGSRPAPTWAGPGTVSTAGLTTDRRSVPDCSQ